MIIHAYAATASAPRYQPPVPDVYDQRAFGFWLYLMSDAIVFSLLFASYAVMASKSDGGPTGQTLFGLSHTFGETLLLLFSSITFGLATLAMKSDKRAPLLAWLLVTFILGLGFVGMEFRDFHRMVQVDAGPDRSGFLSAFFTLVGTHGLHVSFGLVWILVLGSQVVIKGLTIPVVARLLRLGLFWHFLDIIWIGIFSIVYLPGIL